VAIYPFAGLDNDRVTPVDVWRRAAGAGVSGRLQATSIIDEPDGGPATLGAERLTLGPGAGIAAHGAGTVELVVAESGSLTLAASSSTIWLTRTPEFGTGSQMVIEPEVGPRGTGELMLASGDAAVIHRGNVQSIRSAGTEPVELLLIRIVPVGSE
jgi:hypothetical protein